ncbi:hypothetical protein TNCV_1822401 [Trichonephila clavipes]|nr:hypothetical protein TNCV_1822401 [Trichonephila clavipes]
MKGRTRDSTKAPPTSLIFGHSVTADIQIQLRVQENKVLKTSKDQGVQRHLMNMKRWIVRQVRINPRTSAVKMTLQCKSRLGKSVNPETVRNVLKHKYLKESPRAAKQTDKLG